MKLNEKILYCRKRLGLSQEALAERIGVSRQAVSKWETGDAEPEISKLRSLAQVFGVTTDWLLSDAEPDEQHNKTEEKSEAVSPSWVNEVPGAVGRLLRRYGWLCGVYLAVSGFFFSLTGALAMILPKVMARGMDSAVSRWDPFGIDSEVAIYDELGNQVGSYVTNDQGFFSSFAANNPVSIMGTVVLVLGIIMIIAGVILAIVLKRRGRH